MRGRLDGRQRLRDGLRQTAALQQVVWWIAQQGKFGAEQDVCPLNSRLLGGRDDAPGVAGDIPDPNGELGKGDTGLAQPRASAMALPISAGDRTVLTPAASSAANLSSAVPLPPAMMAPACPIRFPGGAVTPAM